jgi:hypothetical protein
MIRYTFILLLTLVLSTSASAQMPAPIGQPLPAITDPPIVPDQGSIENKPAADSTSFVNCWIVRKKTTAIAIRVIKVPNPLGPEHEPILVAKLRQYASEDEEGYLGVKTVIKDGATPLAEAKIIDLKLVKEENANHPDLYRLQFDKDSTANEDFITIGFINFIRGNHDRSSSKAAIKILATPAVGVTVTPASDPCSEPPVDDIGEEEVIARSTVANQSEAPTNSVNRIVQPAP